MPDTRIGQKGIARRADPCHKAPIGASAGSTDDAIKSVAISVRARGLFPQAQLPADPVPDFLAGRRQRLDRPDHDLEFDHFAGRDVRVRFFVQRLDLRLI